MQLLFVHTVIFDNQNLYFISKNLLKSSRDAFKCFGIPVAKCSRQTSLSTDSMESLREGTSLPGP